MTLSISSFVWTFERFTEARLQTAVFPSFFSFSTINISLSPSESRAVIFLAFLVMPLSSVTSSFSGYILTLPSTKVIFIS
jgi:hypothetical protein